MLRCFTLAMVAFVAGCGSHHNMSSGDLALAPDLGDSCPNPVSYNMNGYGCGAERWNIKTGTDPGITDPMSPYYIDMTKVQPTTIADIVKIPAPNPIPRTRVAPAETTIWIIKNVTLNLGKSEGDSDYHLVISDGTNTMIVEVPFPGCVNRASPFYCFIEHARHVADNLSGGETVTVVGVGMFDFAHGQIGYAANGIELHPVIGICSGQDCTPDTLNML
jgi:hypothetical protein